MLLFNVCRLALLFMVVQSIFLTGCAKHVRETSVWQPDPILLELGQQRHQVCLSLSGGGLRSAAFSIGVMQGLHDLGLLDGNTIVSATSGGAYAASWLYIADQLRGMGLSTALDSSGPEQRRLARDVGAFMNRPLAIYAATTGLVLEPPFFASRRFSCSDGKATLRPSGGSPAYGFSISRVFHGSHDVQTLRMDSRLKAASAESGTLRLPIISVSMTSGAEPSCDRDFLREDLTAAWFSESGLTTIKGEKFLVGNISFRSLITSAGAAIDVSPRLLDFGNDEVGNSRDYPRLDVCSLPSIFRPRLGHAFCATNYNSDTNLKFITDGGFTDNLALLPLLDEDCTVIISSDASHDPTLTFGASLRQIEEHLQTHGLDTQGIIEQIRPKGDYPSEAFLADRSLTSVAGGELNGSRSFWLLKLSVPESGSSHVFPDSVQKRLFEEKDLNFGVNGCMGDGLSKRCRFPQQTTVVQAYSSETFTAYRDLGRWIVREQLSWRLRDALN